MDIAKINFFFNSKFLNFKFQILKPFQQVYLQLGFTVERPWLCPVLFEVESEDLRNFCKNSKPIMIDKIESTSREKEEEVKEKEEEEDAMQRF